MSNHSIIELFFNPKSVAVIGASKNPMKGGNRIVLNLVSNNFKGKIFPVNPNAEGKIYGLSFEKTIMDIEDDIDLAIFYVPNRVIPDLIRDCIQKGIRGAIIEASGFEEVGDEGLKLRDKIQGITDNFTKIRIVGPNCMGITKIEGDSDSESENKGGFFSSFVPFFEYKRGNIAIITQSGMLNGGYFAHLLDNFPEMGFRYSCSIGNKMDLGEVEFLEYLIYDPTVNVIAIYLESFKNPRKFIDLCKKTKNMPNKTIILIKGGSTEEGQKATLSHTGALAENEEIIKGIIKQAGVIQANNFYELFQYTRTFSMIYTTQKNLPKHGYVSMVTGSGGAGTISADLVKKYGLSFPNFSDSSYHILKEIFPKWMPPNRFSLIDIWPAMEKAMNNRINPREMMQRVYKLILDDPQIEGIFLMEFCMNNDGRQSRFKHIIKFFENTSKPIFFWLIGQATEIQRVSQYLAENDIPNFPNLEDMIKNFKILVQESKSKNYN
ncbi:MAG: CoA-binding protein [Candidatus Thorarchaeota archaeon]